MPDQMWSARFCLSVLPGTDLYERSDALDASTKEPLQLTFERTPPYHVLNTPTFPAADLARAATLAAACSLFYTQGRAVPWFNAVLQPLRMKPSAFFEDFAKFTSEHASVPVAPQTTASSPSPACPPADVTPLQLAFVREQYTRRHLD